MPKKSKKHLDTSSQDEKKHADLWKFLSIPYNYGSTDSQDGQIRGEDAKEWARLRAIVVRSYSLAQFDKFCQQYNKEIRDLESKPSTTKLVDPDSEGGRPQVKNACQSIRQELASSK